MNMHMMIPNEDIIAAAQRSLAASWDGATMLRQMVLLSSFLKTIEPVVPVKDRRYELASEALVQTARPQDWKTIRKLMTYRMRLSADTVRRLIGTPHDIQSVLMQLKALDAAGQKAFVDDLLAGGLAARQESWRQFIGIWKYRKIYPTAPTRDTMKLAVRRAKARHYHKLRKLKKADEDGTHVDLSVQRGIRRLMNVWNEVPPLARLMFLDEQEKLDAASDEPNDEEATSK